MSDLRTVTLGEITQNHDARRRPIKTTERIQGPYPYYGASGVIDFVDDFIYDGDYLLIAEDGENLRTRSTPIAFLARGQFWANNHAHVVQGNEYADTRFLSHLLSITEIAGYLTGSTQPKLTRSALDSIVLSIPATSTQIAIAEVLGALDDKIAVNTRLAATSAKLAMATFERAIASGSIERTISDMTNLVSRGITPAYSTSGEAVTVLNQRCIRDQTVLLGPARKTLRARMGDEKVLRREDVLINSTGVGTLGRVARWAYDEEATVDSHISIVRFDEEVVDPTCAGYSVLRLQSLIEQMGEGSTGQTELSRAELGKVLVRLPDRRTQFEVGRRLRSLSRLQNAKRSENHVLAKMRDTLLPQLMSGKIRVKDAEKTVEEVL